MPGSCAELRRETQGGGPVAPGATRIAITGSKDALAFKNPDGSIVTEIYNGGPSPKTTSIGVGSALYRFDVPSHGWATLRIKPVP